MHNRIYLIVSIVLKNHFTNIEILKDPSKHSGVILPPVPMETRSLVLSEVIMNGICRECLSGQLGGAHVVFIITGSVCGAPRPVFIVGILEMVLFSGLVQFNFSKGILPVSARTFLAVLLSPFCACVRVCVRAF